MLEADREWRVSASVGGVAVAGSPVVLQFAAKPLVVSEHRDACIFFLL